MNKPCSDTTSKCPHYLPNYIRWDEESKEYLYRNDRSANMEWISTKSIRDAEHRSGYPRKQWVECPMYAKDKEKKGHKYIPRNDTVMMKRYISEFYPNSIKLKDDEDINKINRIWVYEDGFYSHQLEQKKKNLERNCTNGIKCPNLLNGKCPFNHYVENGISSNLCISDKGEKFSNCTMRYCPCDHSIDRRTRCLIIDTAIEKGVIDPNIKSLDVKGIINVVEFMNSGNINGMNIISSKNKSEEDEYTVFSISSESQCSIEDQIDNMSDIDSFSEVTDDSYLSDHMDLEEVNEEDNFFDYGKGMLDSSLFKIQPYEVRKSDEDQSDRSFMVTSCMV